MFNSREYLISIIILYSNYYAEPSYSLNAPRRRLATQRFNEKSVTHFSRSRTKKQSINEEAPHCLWQPCLLSSRLKASEEAEEKVVVSSYHEVSLRFKSRMILVTKWSNWVLNSEIKTMRPCGIGKVCEGATDDCMPRREGNAAQSDDYRICWSARCIRVEYALSMVDENVQIWSNDIQRIGEVEVVWV